MRGAPSGLQRRIRYSLAHFDETPCRTRHRDALRCVACRCTDTSIVSARSVRAGNVRPRGMSSGEATSSRRTADALASAFARRAWNVVLSRRHLRVRRSVQARCGNQRSGGRGDQSRQALSRHGSMGDDDAWIRQLAGMRSQSGAEKRAGSGGETAGRSRAGVE